MREPTYGGREFYDKQEGRMRECGECFSDKGFPERRDGKGQQKAVGT